MYARKCWYRYQMLHYLFLRIAYFNECVFFFYFYNFLYALHSPTCVRMSCSMCEHSSQLLCGSHLSPSCTSSSLFLATQFMTYMQNGVYIFSITIINKPRYTYAWTASCLAVRVRVQIQEYGSEGGCCPRTYLLSTKGRLEKVQGVHFAFTLNSPCASSFASSFPSTAHP